MDYKKIGLYFLLLLGFTTQSKAGTPGTLTPVKPFPSEQRCEELLALAALGDVSHVQPLSDQPLPQKLENRLKQLGLYIGGQKVEALRDEPDWETDSESSRKILFHYRKIQLAEVNLYKTNQTLRFDIWVNPNFRGCGLYEFTFREALFLHPEVTVMPSSMVSMSSDNATFYLSKVFGDVKNFETFDLETSSADERKKLRSKLLEQIWEMPALKTRKKFGFSRLKKLMFYPAKAGIQFIVEKGDKLSLDEIEILWWGQAQHRLEPNGEITPLDELQFEIQDFPIFMLWGEKEFP